MEYIAWAIFASVMTICLTVVSIKFNIWWIIILALIMIPVISGRIESAIRENGVDRELAKAVVDKFIDGGENDGTDPEKMSDL